MEARKRKGPRPKMQAMERQALRELILEHPLSTAGELVKLLRARTGTSVSVPTLVKAIKTEGIVRVKPPCVSGYVQPTPDGPPRYGYNERHRDEGDHERYATSLTQAEWEMVADIFDDAGERGRPAVHARRAIVDACFYVVRTGCSWRLMPKTFPPWNAVYKLFRRWSRQGRFERMHDRLRVRWRERAERDEQVGWVERSDTHHLSTAELPRFARVTFFVAKKVTKENSLVPRQICRLRCCGDFSMRHPAASKNGAHPAHRPSGLQAWAGSLA